MGFGTFLVCFLVFCAIVLVCYGLFYAPILQEKREAFLKENFPVITKEIDFKNGVKVLIDDENGLIAIFAYFTEPFTLKKIPYKKLINFELATDSKQTLIQGKGMSSATGAVVGTLAFGPLGCIAGSVVGASAGNKKIIEKGKTIHVNLHIDDLENPLVVIDCYFAALPYETCLANAKELIAVLDTIKHRTNKKPQSSEEEKSSLSDLEKLAELRDKGIITEEEFQAKKKQILGL